MFDDLDKVCADVVLLYGRPQNCMSNRVEGLLEVYDDMVAVLLVLVLVNSSCYDASTVKLWIHVGYLVPLLPFSLLDLLFSHHQSSASTSATCKCLSADH